MNLFRPNGAAYRAPLARRAAVALVIIGLALSLSLLFRFLFGSGTFLLFFGAVALIAAYSGLRIGLAGVVAALVLLRAFAFPPFDSFALTADAIARVGIFVMVISLIGWLSEARRASHHQREELLAREQLARNQLATVLERERMVQQRTGLLAELGMAMNSSLDYLTTLQQFAHTVVPFLADFCIVYIEQPSGALERVVMVHHDPEIEALLSEINSHDAIDPQGPNPVAQVLRSGRPDVSFALSAHDAQTRTDSDAQRRANDILQPRAYMVMPLIARGHTLGAISFAMTASGRSYGQDDVALAEEVARRAALAVDNAQLYQQAQDALQVREQFMSIAAHELKTPLTTLTGQVQLMQRRAEQTEGTPERDRRSLLLMSSQVRRLSNLVNALLDISRIETGKLTIERAPVDICALVRQVASEVQATLEDRQIGVDCPETPLFVLGDALRLEQVMLNLIQNALNYSQPPAPLTVTVRQVGERIAIGVQDHGIGIPAAALPHLFTRFYRAGNAETHYSGGMGIGLSVVKEIVSLHQGDVQVESVEGAGSTFTIDLPLAIDQAVAELAI